MKIFTSLLAAMSIIAMALSASVVYAGSTDASVQNYTPIQLAQTRNQAPRIIKPSDNLKAPGGESEVDCNGQTAEECCEGIAFCACLGNPLGGNPIACFSSPPSDDDSSDG